MTSYQQDEGRDQAPCDPPEYARFAAQHQRDILRERAVAWLTHIIFLVNYP